MEKKLIGRVGVDSGRLMVSDPCYAEKIKCVSVQKVFENIHENDGAASLHYKGGSEGLGVVFSSGMGDGLYDVYAYYTDVPGMGRRIAKVEIDFGLEGDACDTD